MASTINSARPRTGDKSNPSDDIRANFAIAKSEISRLHFLAYDLGPAVLLTAPGDDSATIDLTATKVTMTSSGAAASDDVSLAASTRHGHDMMIILGTRADASDTVVLKPASAGIIVNAAGTAVTSVTFDAANEYCHLTYDLAAAKWRIQSTNATVAT